MISKQIAQIEVGYLVLVLAAGSLPLYPPSQFGVLGLIALAGSLVLHLIAARRDGTRIAALLGLFLLNLLILAWIGVYKPSTNSMWFPNLR